MSVMQRLFRTLLRTISDLREGAGYIGTFLWAFLHSRATLAARVLAAESQLAVRKRRIEEKNQPKPRFTQAFRLLWVLLSKVWSSVASGGAAHAACNGQEMAHPNISSLLALEVEGAAGSTSHPEADAGSDSPAKPRESSMER